MNIVLEGPDNAGKSTLASLISSALCRPIIVSEGREKFPGEVNERVTRYKEFKEVVFDRHPVISQTVYSLVKPNTPVHPVLIEEFYNTKPFLIYCRPLPQRKMEGHVVKDYDDPAYLAEIEQKYTALTEHYDLWALHRAAMIYRIGDDTDLLITMLKTLTGEK